jgi:hypothetical protein
VRARELILKPKTVTKAGEWKTGKMTRNAFPLSPARSFRLGASWTWRIDVLEIDRVECRLLTAFDPLKQRFMAWLSYQRGDSYTVIARLEFHASEPGLHCHAACDRPVHETPVGIVKPFGTRRVPRYGTKHRRIKYDMTEASALNTSFRFFKIEGTPDDAMI